MNSQQELRGGGGGGSYKEGFYQILARLLARLLGGGGGSYKEINGNYQTMSNMMIIQW